MSWRGRDNRSRVPNTGENQKSNGLYVFKYLNRDKKPKFIYSRRLVEADRFPAGKRPCRPLRKGEKEVRRDLEGGIDPISKKMTASQLYAKFTRCRLDIREGVERLRAQLERLLFEGTIGSWEIGSMKTSSVKERAQRVKSKGFAYSTISSHKRSLKVAFYLAIADDCICKNPLDFELATVIRRNVVGREPLSREQVDALLGSTRLDAVYHRYTDEVVILLGTGLRISEMCGLTEADIDLTNRVILMDRRLARAAGGRYQVDESKAESGRRYIYMTDGVMAAFEHIMASRPEAKPLNVDGRTGFIFLNRDGLPRVGGDYDRVFRGLRCKCAKSGCVELPGGMTSHTLCHTFCTEMTKAGMDPKALQYIMDHKDIKTTLGYYAHMDGYTAAEEMRRITAQQKRVLLSVLLLTGIETRWNTERHVSVPERRKAGSAHGVGLHRLLESNGNMLENVALIYKINVQVKFMHLFFYAEEGGSMKRRLVAYFSADGTTKKVAEMIANCTNADLIEITPETPYTERDLDWTGKKSRSSIEMSDKTYRPGLLDIDINMNTYHEVILGLPIWWYVAPTIVHTFLEEYNFSDKKMILFATSGRSGFGNTMRELQPSVSNSVIEGERIFNDTTRQ